MDWLNKSQKKKREILADMYGPICSTRNGHGCGRIFDLRDLTMDHITPKWKGGTHDLSNLQLLCIECHTEKNRNFDSRTMSPVPFMLNRYIEVINSYKNRNDSKE